MKRRWIIRILFLLPILLSSIGWAWSGMCTSWIGYTYRDYEAAASIYDGVIELGIGNGDDLMPFPTRGWNMNRFRGSGRYLPEESSKYLGFQNIKRGGNYILDIPFWFLIVVFSGSLFFVWRKTRPRVQERAFPVEPGAQP